MITFIKKFKLFIFCQKKIFVQRNLRPTFSSDWSTWTRSPPLSKPLYVPDLRTCSSKAGVRFPLRHLQRSSLSESQAKAPKTMEETIAALGKSLGQFCNHLQSSIDALHQSLDHRFRFFDLHSVPELARVNRERRSRFARLHYVSLRSLWLLSSIILFHPTQFPSFNTILIELFLVFLMYLFHVSILSLQNCFSFSLCILEVSVTPTKHIVLFHPTQFPSFNTILRVRLLWYRDLCKFSEAWLGSKWCCTIKKHHEVPILIEVAPSKSYGNEILKKEEMSRNS